MNAIAVDRHDWVEAVPLTDHDALRRLIEYARAEAAEIGENVCAEFLSAALMTLVGLSQPINDAFACRPVEPTGTWL